MMRNTSNLSFFKTACVSIFILALSSVSAYAEKARPADSDFNHLRLIHDSKLGDFIELTNASGKTNGARFGLDSSIHLTIIPVKETGWVDAKDFNQLHGSECVVSAKDTCAVTVDKLKVTGISIIKLAKNFDTVIR